MGRVLILFALASFVGYSLAFPVEYDEGPHVVRRTRQQAGNPIPERILGGILSLRSREHPQDFEYTLPAHTFGGASSQDSMNAANAAAANGGLPGTTGVVGGVPGVVGGAPGVVGGVPGVVGGAPGVVGGAPGVVGGVPGVVGGAPGFVGGAAGGLGGLGGATGGLQRHYSKVVKNVQYPALAPKHHYNGYHSNRPSNPYYYGKPRVLSTTTTSFDTFVPAGGLAGFGGAGASGFGGQGTGQAGAVGTTAGVPGTTAGGVPGTTAGGVPGATAGVPGSIAGVPGTTGGVGTDITGGGGSGGSFLPNYNVNDVFGVHEDLRNNLIGIVPG